VESGINRAGDGERLGEGVVIESQPPRCQPLKGFIFCTLPLRAEKKQVLGSANEPDRLQPEGR
jgi:hypothetical protein